MHRKNAGGGPADAWRSKRRRGRRRAEETMNVRMLTEKITGPQAWTRASISPADWTVELTPAALAELRAVMQELRRSPLPLFLLDPRDHALDACREVMARVREATL